MSAKDLRVEIVLPFLTAAFAVGLIAWGAAWIMRFLELAKEALR